jgi:hypothetical protein
VLEGLEHARGAAHRVEVFVAGVVGRRVALGEDRDDGRRQVVDVLDEGDRLLATDVEGRDRAREQHRVADRKDQLGSSSSEVGSGRRANMLRSCPARICPLRRS